MDDKRELNDILIGGEDNRTRRSKSLLLLVAGIIVLVIAIAAIALSMTGNKQEEIVIDTMGADSATPTFDNVPVASEEEDKFARIVQEIKKQQGTESQDSPLPEPPSAANDEPKATMPARPTDRVAITTTPKPQPSRPSGVASAFRGNNGDIAENGYYLQVGAFGNKPNADFMSRIDRYSYRIQEIMINSKVITRYLVGPYSNRSEAQLDYDNVTRDIAKPVYLEVR